MKSDDLLQRAERIMPGGVSSPVRAFRGVGGRPRVIARAKGAHMWDVEGQRFADLQMAFGPLILGHAHPAVVQAVQDASARGLAYGAPNPDEIALAETVVERHPATEWIRFVNSGTEAVMSAARLARAATGRNLLLKFDGGYHGHADAFLARAGSGLATFDIPASAGVTPSTTADTKTLPLDDEAALDAFFAAHGHELAAAIVEGVPANNGLLPQRKEWHARLRRLTREHGALLIVDEVITGFRLAWGGAAEALGLQPDIVTLGKIVGGGMPVGAYGGRKELMQLVAPLGPMYQAGTLSGNPVSMAAGLTTLRALDAERDVHATLRSTTDEFARRISDLAADAKFPLTTRALASILWLIPQDDFTALDATPLAKESVARFAKLHANLLRQSVYLPPSTYEVCFLSIAHTPDVLDEAAHAFERSFREARA